MTIEAEQRSMRSWIEREFAIDGVLAAGGGRGAAFLFSAFASGELVLGNDERVWRCVAENVAALHAQGAPVGELLWGFENAVLCTVCREDSSWLGVFTVPDLADEPALVLRSKLDAFKLQQFREA